jgi:hypothetical protein
LNAIEFGIYEIVEDGGNLHVVGRCHKGPIKIGDRFSLQYRLEIEMDGGDYGPSSRRNESPIDLVVVCIRAYKRDLRELDEGMTAQMELLGHADLESGIAIGS